MRIVRFSFLCLFFLSACSKKNEGSCPSNFTVTASTLTPTVGETVTLTASPERWNYLWNGPQGFFVNQTTGVNTITIEDIKLNQSGWYVGSLTGTGCGVLLDSVYIDVKYKQGDPPCSLTNNQVSSSSLPDLQASSIRKYYDISFNGITLHAAGSYGYPTYSFIFNSYNGNAEPKDGLYVTTNVPVFDHFQDANVVVGICQYGSYYFQTHANQTVYVSHVNGKLRVSFCDLKYSGDNGNSVMVTSTFSGQLTEK